MNDNVGSLDLPRCVPLCVVALALPIVIAIDTVPWKEGHQVCAEFGGYRQFVRSPPYEVEITLKKCFTGFCQSTCYLLDRHGLAKDRIK
jgi:hypothetical protein